MHFILRPAALAPRALRGRASACIAVAVALALHAPLWWATRSGFAPRSVENDTRRSPPVQVIVIESPRTSPPQRAQPASPQQAPPASPPRVVDAPKPRQTRAHRAASPAAATVPAPMVVEAPLPEPARVVPEPARVVPEPARPSTQVDTPLLDGAATRRAIRALAREPSLAERAALASGQPPRASRGEALAEDIERNAIGDCSKGEYAGAGMGLLSLPFWLLAELRERCAR